MRGDHFVAWDEDTVTFSIHTAVNRAKPENQAPGAGYRQDRLICAAAAISGLRLTTIQNGGYGS